MPPLRSSTRSSSSTTNSSRAVPRLTCPPFLARSSSSSPRHTAGLRGSGPVADKLAAELLVERLIDWGVDTVFGLPGDGVNGIMESLRRHQDRIRFLLVHHEEAAAF